MGGGSGSGKRINSEKRLFSIGASNPQCFELFRVYQGGSTPIFFCLNSANLPMVDWRMRGIQTGSGQQCVVKGQDGAVVTHTQTLGLFQRQQRGTI